MTYISANTQDWGMKTWGILINQVPSSKMLENLYNGILTYIFYLFWIAIFLFPSLRNESSREGRRFTDYILFNVWQPSANYIHWLELWSLLGCIPNLNFYNLSLLVGSLWPRRKIVLTLQNKYILNLFFYFSQLIIMRRQYNYCFAGWDHLTNKKNSTL